MVRISCWVIAAWLLVLPVAAQDDELRQWANSATATSQYGSAEGWSALQATGEPDTTGCEDAPTAWASASQIGVDSLTVYFELGVYPTQINIHQNYGRGSITGVELIPLDGSANIVLRGTSDRETDCPGVFTIDVQSVDEPVNGVVIHVDQQALQEWNEIDAVELVGIMIAGLEAEGNPLEEETEEETYEYSSDLPFGRSVRCDDGSTFDNGLEFTVVQMRSRSTYTVTAIGLGDFDPVLAVLTDSGTGLCNDDSVEASYYAASLPTTGDVYPSNRSAQVVFTNRPAGQAFRDITFVVGGRNNQSGQFVLLLEGMTLMYEDGMGDVFSAYLAPGMIASGVPLSAYMISVTDVFDPWIGLIDGERNFLRDADKNYYACDDAGTGSCWGESNGLEGFGVSRSDGRVLGGGFKDAMLMIPLVAGMEGTYVNYVMSTIQGTYGDYIVAFHTGIGGD